MDLEQVLGEAEKVYLAAALQHAGGSAKKAATLLGLTLRSLRYRMTKLGVEVGEE
jgi:two-component system, NtrC family, response regulator PilR